MIKEIHEQPAALAKTLKQESKNVLAIAEAIRKYDPAFLVLVARGTSDNAATYAKYLFEYANGIPAVLAAPSIFTIYGKSANMKKSLVIGISQSGEGTDINEFLADAQKQGAFTIGITNTAGSAITKAAGHSIMLRAGKENALAATKTYTCQLLSLLMLSEALKNGKKGFDRLQSLPDEISKVLEVEPLIKELSCRYRYMEHSVIIGRGMNYCTVKEAALKMMETSYVVAQPFSTADFLHGPIAMAGVGFPVFIANPSGVMAPQINKLIADLGERRVETIVVSALKSALAKAEIPIALNVDPEETISPIHYIVPFQFLACYISMSKGIDPDAPRYLKKVTRTR